MAAFTSLKSKKACAAVINTQELGWWDAYRPSPPAHLPADGSTARHAWATRSVELDSPLQVCETGALLERLVPPGPTETETVISADMLVGWVDLGRRKTYLDSSMDLIAMTMFCQAAVRVQVRRRLAHVVECLLDGNGNL